MKFGSILMRYGLDASGNEISARPLCASESYKKVYDKLRKIAVLEERRLDDGDEFHDYDNQVVVMYAGEYEEENGVRYIIESLEIL